MKKLLFFILTIYFSNTCIAQKDTQTLATINGKEVTVGDFKKMYEKNIDVIDNEEGLDVAKNLTLFINYKLKVTQAYQLKLDTLKTYQKEVEDFKNQLASPYLQDTAFVNGLVKEAYERSKYQIKAKHILVKVAQDATPKDTLIAFEKITKIRERIINGEKFETVAKETSEDPSAVRNGGDLGYFDAFTMVYNFEDAAYKTTPGKVSMPFRTRFGYHFVGVDEKRISKGEVEVAHILVADSSQVGRNKIQEAYAKLKNNEKFEDVAKTHSNDSGSKDKGGKLGKIKNGRMVQPFDTAIFNLKEVGEYSAPFETIFGWHIVKLIKKYPVQSFDEMKETLTQKVSNNERNQLSKKSVINKLRKKYVIIENEEGKAILYRKDIRKIAEDSLQNVLFSIENKKITQLDFVKYIKYINGRSTVDLYENYLDNEILTYYKKDLVNKEPAYANTLNEYKDGLLLFELMQQKIWDKSVKDTLGLQQFFDKNIGNYKSDILKDVKGLVMSDYQTDLEGNWIAALRKNNSIKINKRALRKLIKYYEKKK